MEILDIVVHAICEKKAQDVRVYDVTSLTPFMDSMIVCSTTNIVRIMRLHKILRIV